MKIVTWNINGIRSMKKQICEVLNELDCDIVCFQETKISRSQVPEDVALVNGYSSYYGFPKWRSGYSGVATYCKDTCTPTKAVEGLRWDTSPTSVALNELPFDITPLDNEGRVIITTHDVQVGDNIEKLAVINVYCPRVDCEKPERKIYKMQFCQLLEARARSLVQEGYHVLILGDLNIAHQPIDHCDPCDEKEFKAHEARMWLTSFLDSNRNEKDFSDKKKCNFVDSFRFLHPEQKEAFTCWNTLTGARQTNYGTRIDYILGSEEFLPLITSCEILSDVYGSDHCPVRAIFCCEPVPSSQFPSLCCRMWPEFAGQQQKLLNFLSKQPSLSKDVHKRVASDVPASQTDKKSKKACSGQKQKSITNFFIGSRVKKEISENASVNESVPIHTAIFDTQKSSEKSNSIVLENGSQSDEMSSTEVSSNKSQSELWKRVLSGPPPPPLCEGHGKSCVLRTVKKEGYNLGRQFFACPQPNGLATNPESRCNFFQWATAPKINMLKRK